MGLVVPRHVGSSRTRARTVSPALAGGFLTTAPPGKSVTGVSNCKFSLLFLIISDADNKSF